MGKKPFTGKAKKAQLQQKRARKRGELADLSRAVNQKVIVGGGEGESSQLHSAVQGGSSGYATTRGDAGATVSRYALRLEERESKEEVDSRAQQTRNPLVVLPPSALETSVPQLHKGETTALLLRPPWSTTTSAEELAAAEETALSDYIETVKKECEERKEPVSYFEGNIETWRQLWHVLDRLDVAFFLVDIRYASLHFSPALYRHITETLKKPFVLILNKCDLVSEDTVEAWKEYFQKDYPNIHLATFKSFQPTSSKKKHRQQMSKASGPEQLLNIWKALNLIGAEEWADKMRSSDVEPTRYKKGHVQSFPGEDDHSEQEQEHASQLKISVNDVYTTIGLLGQPNVGKSTVLNALMGRKVVQCSITPGRTKKFQTHFMTPSIQLCDCPGMVFPASAPKPLQVLAGLYPAAQLREPYSAVEYLAQRMDLVELLKLSPPEFETNDSFVWSGWAIVEAYCEKRRYYIAKSGRPDMHRAANEIVRNTVEGRIILSLKPPGYHKDNGIPSEMND